MKRGTSATTRLRKVECWECGCVMRMSRSWIARGLSHGCPVCGGELSCPATADAVLADPNMLDKMNDRDRNNVCRELGWDLGLMGSVNHGAAVAAARSKVAAKLRREAKVSDACPF